VPLINKALKTIAIKIKIENVVEGVVDGVIKTVNISKTTIKRAIG
jgi:hypothetical protein